jgi:hypothetical protein
MSIVFQWIYDALFPESKEVRGPEKRVIDGAKVARSPTKQSPPPEPLDIESAGVFKSHIENIDKATDHPRIRKALVSILKDVLPLLTKSGSARAIDDIMTRELEALDCVDTSMLPSEQSSTFRQARREFNALCSLIDAAIPPEGHERSHLTQEAPLKRKKRRKRG